MSSFDDYIQMQERLNQQLNILSSPLLNPYPSFLNPAAELGQMAYSPIQEWAESYMKILAPIQEMLDNLTNSSAASVAAAIQDPIILAASFQEIIPPDIVQNFEKLNTFSVEQFSMAFNPLFSAIDNIRISPDHIEVPDELVPKKLFPEVTLSENVSGNVSTKKLSRDQALAIIGILLTIMFWILNNMFPASWQQKHHDEILQSLEKQNNLLEESNQIQKKQNNLLEESNQIQAERAQLEKEQLQAIKEQTQVLETIEHLLGIQNDLLSLEAAAPSESSAAGSKVPDADPESSAAGSKVPDTDPESSAAGSKAASAEAESLPSDEPHPTPD